MADHIKPTREEIQSNLDKIQEEINAPEVPENPETTPEDATPPVEEQPETPAVETPEENPEEVQETETPETTPKDPEVPEEDAPEDDEYKKKYTASQQEAIILNERNKKHAEAIDRAGLLPEPTEDELKEAYSDWDEMTNTERMLAKDNLWNKRKLDEIAKSAQEGKDLEAWNTKVSEMLDDPQTLINHPKLEGKQHAFKVFALKPTRRGVDMETLITSFLYTTKSERKENKGSNLPVSNNTIVPPKPKPTDTITQEQAQVLMRTNYSEYKKKLMAGKIEPVKV